MVSMDRPESYRTSMQAGRCWHRTPQKIPGPDIRLRARAYLFLKRMDEPVDLSRLERVELVPPATQANGDLPHDEDRSGRLQVAPVTDAEREQQCGRDPLETDKARKEPEQKRGDRPHGEEEDERDRGVVRQVPGRPRGRHGAGTD